MAEVLRLQWRRHHLLGLDEHRVSRLSSDDGGMDLWASVGFHCLLEDALEALQLSPCKMFITMQL